MMFRVADTSSKPPSSLEFVQLGAAATSVLSKLFVAVGGLLKRAAESEAYFVANTAAQLSPRLIVWLSKPRG